MHYIIVCISENFKLTDAGLDFPDFGPYYITAMVSGLNLSRLDGYVPVHVFE